MDKKKKNRMLKKFVIHRRDGPFREENHFPGAGSCLTDQPEEFTRLDMSDAFRNEPKSGEIQRSRREKRLRYRGYQNESEIYSQAAGKGTGTRAEKGADKRPVVLKDQQKDQQKNRKYRLERTVDTQTGRKEFRLVPNRREVIHSVHMAENTYQFMNEAGVISRRMTEFAWQNAEQQEKNRQQKNRSPGNFDFQSENAFRQDRAAIEQASEAQKRDIRKRLQKNRIKQEYAKTFRESRITGSMEKAGSTGNAWSILKSTGNTGKKAENAADIAIKAGNFIHDHALAVAISAGILLLLVTVIACLSLVVMMLGGGLSNVAAGTYQSLPEEIDRAENRMTWLEMKLQKKIDNTPTDYPDYDEYTYLTDPIGHNPFTLINYLSAVHVEFTGEDVEDEIGILFDLMYDLTRTEKEEIRTRTVSHITLILDGETGEITEETEEEEQEYTVKILETKLNSKTLEEVAEPTLSDEEWELYLLYKQTKGAVQHFYSPVRLDWQSRVKSYYGYRKSPYDGSENFHWGLDIKTPGGTGVYAAQDGIVTEAGLTPDNENYIEIGNADGYYTKYVRIYNLQKSPGDPVSHGEWIGTAGEDLHIECIYNGRHYNPVFYFENGADP